MKLCDLTITFKCSLEPMACMVLWNWWIDGRLSL